MSWLDWILLGVLQGLTEFLPVSSSGHLVLAQTLLGVRAPGVLLEVTVHAATAVAVLVLFAGELWAMLVALVRWLLGSRGGRRPGGRRPAGAASSIRDSEWRGLLANIILATAVTAAIGFAFQPFFRNAFERPTVAAAMLLVTGVILFATSRLRPGRRELGHLRPADAVVVGVAQGLAILPGLSRSGLTIVGGLTRKLSGAAAARFSFLLSLPAIAGATLVEVVGSDELRMVLSEGAQAPIKGLVLASAAAFVSGLLAMLLLIRVVERGRLYRFAWYCWLVGGTALVWLLMR